MKLGLNFSEKHAFIYIFFHKFSTLAEFPHWLQLRQSEKKNPFQFCSFYIAWNSLFQLFLSFLNSYLAAKNNCLENKICIQKLSISQVLSR